MSFLNYLSAIILVSSFLNAVEARHWDGVNQIKLPSPFLMRGGSVKTIKTTGKSANNNNSKRRRKKKYYNRTVLKWKTSLPTDQDVCNIFDLNEKPTFNHGFVGITNPCLHAHDVIQQSSTSTDKEQVQQSVNLVSSRHVQKDSISTSLNDVESCGWWIPDGIEDTLSKDESISSTTKTKNKHPPPTRILRYRRKVGNGQECYAKLRDVALQWERMHEGSAWAGVKVLKQTTPDGNNASTTSSSAKEIMSPLPSHISQNVYQIWSEPGGRKLATLSRIGTNNSPIWAVNPCGVVYDLVDCRSKDMTYSSTAYATLRGHLLAGEERVTVAIRDGGTNQDLNKVFFASNDLNAMSSNDGAGDVYVEILSCSRPAPNILGKVIFPFVKGMQDRFFREEIDTLERISKSASDIGVN